MRARLAARLAVDGAAAGAGLAAAAAGTLWYANVGPHAATLYWGGAAGLCLGGVAVGLAVARARRWSDVDVALFLDARLDSREAITTALELSRAPGAPSGYVVAQAQEALRAPAARRAVPRVWHGWQLGIALGLAALAGVRQLPWPPAPEAAGPPPGAEFVRLADLKGLENLDALPHVRPRDEAQKKRLEALQADAKRLREKLAVGMEKREAQSELAKLAEGIAAERLSFGDGEERAGLEAALGKLAESKQMKGVERALGDRDLVSMDDEMERLANRLESEDRQQAQEVLREAAEAARAKKAPSVAKALEEQAKRLKERGEAMEALRELAKSIEKDLPPAAKDAAKELARSGDPKAAQELSNALAEALKKLSPEERERLAKELAKRAAEAAKGGGEPGEATSDDLKKLVEELSSEEGQKRLEEQLRALANGTPPSEEAERQKRLGEAESGLGGAIPIPHGGNGSGPPGAPLGGAPQAGSPSPQGGQGSPAPGGGGGSAMSSGATAKVDAPGFTSKAEGKLGAGKLMPGSVMGRATGRAGETAHVRGTGALGDVRATEVGGVQRSDVPREYREQVGRYFDPK